MSVIPTPQGSIHSEILADKSFGKTAAPPKAVESVIQHPLPEGEKDAQTDKLKLSELAKHDNRSPHHSERAVSDHYDEAPVVVEQIVQTSARPIAPSQKESVIPERVIETPQKHSMVEETKKAETPAKHSVVEE